MVAAGTGWHRGLSRGGPTVEPQPWEAVGFHGVGSVCQPFPGTASQPPTPGHTGEGFSPVLALSASSLLLPGAAVSPCSPSPRPSLTALVVSQPLHRQHPPRARRREKKRVPVPAMLMGKRQLGGSCALPSLGKCLCTAESGKSPCAGGSGLGWSRGAPHSLPCAHPKAPEGLL